MPASGSSGRAVRLGRKGPWQAPGETVLPISARRLAGSSKIGLGPRPLIEATGRPHRLRNAPQADLISIFFCGFCAGAVFGKVIVATPFERLAATSSRSTLDGSWNERWNEP